MKTRFRCGRCFARGQNRGETIDKGIKRCVRAQSAIGESELKNHLFQTENLQKCARSLVITPLRDYPSCQPHPMTIL